MTYCEHFVYGQFNGVGYRLIRSTGLDQVLSKESMRYLCNIGGKLKQEARIQVWLPQENIVSVSYLKPGKDGYGRRVMWNHTILMPVEEFLKHTSTTLFEPYFIKQLSRAPQELDPIIIKK